MTDFEKWFYTEDAEKFGLYPDIHSARAAWNYQETKLKEMDEVIKLQDTDLRKYEKQIEGLKAQLNNMETCYIQVKKERDELHSATDKALTHVKRQTECFRDLKTDATDMQTKNWWQAKVQILNPIRRMLEAALRGTNG